MNLLIRCFGLLRFNPELFHLLLNPLFKVLFNFSSRYLFAIGLVVVFSLKWILPSTLVYNLKQPDSEERSSQNSYRSLRAFLSLEVNNHIQDGLGRSSTSQGKRILLNTTFPSGGTAGFCAGVIPIRSQLLRKSLLVSFLPLSSMLKFNLTYSKVVITYNKKIQSWRYCENRSTIQRKKRWKEPLSGKESNRRRILLSYSISFSINTVLPPLIEIIEMHKINVKFESTNCPTNGRDLLSEGHCIIPIEREFSTSDARSYHPTQSPNKEKIRALSLSLYNFFRKKNVNDEDWKQKKDWNNSLV